MKLRGFKQAPIISAKSSNSVPFLGHPVQLQPTRIALSVSWFVGQKKDVSIYIDCLKPQSRPKKAKLDI